jgi:hypothetical protein
MTMVTGSVRAGRAAAAVRSAVGPSVAGGGRVQWVRPPNSKAVRSRTEWLRETPTFRDPFFEEEGMSQSTHLPDQPIMKYVHPADRLRPWFGVTVGLVALVGMLAFGILGRNFGTLEHLKALNEAGTWLTMSLIEASAGILALLLAAVALGERIERGVEGPHFISLIRLTARGGFATIAPAVLFDVLKITSTSVTRGGWVVSALIVVQIVLLAATIGAFAFMLSSLWATLKITFVGVPESAPEEDEAEESTNVRS